MNLLFDISPEELPDKKRKKQKREKETAQQSPSPAFEPPRHQSIKAIGKLDGVHACDNPQCRGSAHDILHEDGNEWLIQCCFCNCMQWVPVIEGHLQEEFRLTEGIFAGMVLREVCEKEGGLEYLKFAAKKHTQQKVREACSRFLDQKSQHN